MMARTPAKVEQAGSRIQHGWAIAGAHGHAKDTGELKTCVFNEMPETCPVSVVPAK